MRLSQFVKTTFHLAFIVTILGFSNVRSSSVTTVSIITKYGYPVEEHHVQTTDGYILTMHRIPFSKNTGYDGRRPVMFLMHGLLCSSSDWILGGPEKGLAFLLSEAGYDVWMGNARGNTYSRKHATKSPMFQPFWNFEWHDIGIYDIPAMIDYVLYHTGEPNLQYVGHSQGTTAFFVMTSTLKSMKNRIRSAHLLAPVAWMEHMQIPLAKMVGPLLGQANVAVELLGSAQFMPSSKAMEFMGSHLCRDEAVTQVICANALFLIAGWNSPYLNVSMIPEITATTPAGCSVNQMFHYLQEYNSGHFRQFDHGSIRNKKEYGNKSPPDYNVQEIEVPTYLYYSDNDYFASLIDVDKLRRTLNPNYLRRSYRLPEKKWSHLDFLWGMNITEILYDTVLDDIKNA